MNAIIYCTVVFNREDTTQSNFKIRYKKNKNVAFIVHVEATRFMCHVNYFDRNCKSRLKFAFLFIIIVACVNCFNV